MFTALTLLSEGAVVRIVEEDDGSGWVKAMDGAGKKGLVPASYVEPVDSVETAQPVAAHAPRGSGQGSGKYGKGTKEVLSLGKALKPASFLCPSARHLRVPAARTR